jgi:hypothetical protein
MAHEIKPVDKSRVRPLRAAIREARRVVRRLVKPGRSLADELMRERKRDALRGIRPSLTQDTQKIHKYTTYAHGIELLPKCIGVGLLARQILRAPASECGLSIVLALFNWPCQARRY